MAEFDDNLLIKIGRGILSLLRILPGSGLATLKIAVNQLRESVVEIAEGLASLYTYIRGFLARVLGPLLRLYRGVLRPLFDWLRAQFLRLTAWLSRIFGPLSRLLARIHARLLWFHTRILRPILDYIALTRFALRTLSRLGVEWAAKLEAQLATLELWLVENFRQLLEDIGTLERTIDRIVTLDFFLQRSVFLRTMQRDVALVTSVLHAARLRDDGAGDVAASLKASRPPHIHETLASMEATLMLGSGPYTEQFAGLTRSFLAAAAGDRPAAADDE